MVGRAFLVELMYGSKYSSHIGTYAMPFVYVKTILLCASGRGLEHRESNYIHGLIELLLPSNVSQDNLTKFELMQFVDAMPAGSSEGNDLFETATTTTTADATSAAGEAGDGTFFSTSAGNRELGVDEYDVGSGLQTSIGSFISASTFPATYGRVLVYDAVTTCVADGLYSAKEKERVTLVASEIGLSSSVREQIEKMALREKVLSHRKAILLRLIRPYGSATGAPVTRSCSASSSSSLSATSEEDESGGAGALQERASSSIGSQNKEEAIPYVSVPVAGGGEGYDDVEESPEERAARVREAKALLRRVYAARKANNNSDWRS